MPFSNTQSIVASDINNCWRGLHRNATSTSTSGTGEDDLSSTTMTGNTLTASGTLRILAAGTISGTNDTKTVKLYFGSTVIATVSEASGATDDWIIEAFVFNTATNAQRVIARAWQAAAVEVGDYTTAAIDTTANVTIKVTGECANAGDTVTQTLFDIAINQTS